MNGRWTSKIVFLFFLIIVIILLQLLSKIQSNRFIKKLDSFEKVFFNASAQNKTPAGQTSTVEQGYPSIVHKPGIKEEERFVPKDKQKYK